MNNQDSSSDNEFINTFKGKFKLLENNNSQSNLSKQTSVILQSQTAIAQDLSQQSSAKQILQSSRLKVLNSKRLKSQQSDFHLTQSQLKQSQVSKLKSKQIVAEKIMNERFSQYKDKIAKSINKLEAICEEQFGGVRLINDELNKHALTRQELVQYYAHMLPKNSRLTQLELKTAGEKQKTMSKLPKLRSVSMKNLSNQTQSKKNLNKWYIDPKKRFSIQKDKTLYDWKTSDGIKNVIRKTQLHVSKKEIDKLIQDVKEKYHREPIFCKYTKFC